MKYYLIAGERSGDLHAANLMRALQRQDPSAEFRCWGGDDMASVESAELVVHYREMAFMGFVEVISHLGKIRRLMRLCKKDLLDYRPDVCIFVDYGGFNMRMAKFAKSKGLRTFYYISPKVWAWNTKRALKIKRSVDRMFVIMHFEQAFYERFGYTVDYVGNPLFDAIKAFEPNSNFLQENGLGQKPIVALLPGSRKQEVKRILPVMVAAKRAFPDRQFVVAGVDNLPAELYQQAKHEGLPVVYGQTYDLLAKAEAAVVTSGTATLETALFNVPQVVCYKTSPFSYRIAKALIKVPYISLVNLILGKEAIRELIQSECKPETLKAELGKALGEERPRILADYAEMRRLAETEESASARAARLMWGYLQLAQV